MAHTAPRGGKRGISVKVICVVHLGFILSVAQSPEGPEACACETATPTTYYCQRITNQPFHESFLTAAHCEGPRVRDPRRLESLTLRSFWNQVEIPHLVLASTAHMKCCSYGLRHMLLADRDLVVLPCTRQSRDRVGGAHIASQKMTPAERQLPRSAAESGSTLVSATLVTFKSPHPLHFSCCLVHCTDLLEI